MLALVQEKLRVNIQKLIEPSIDLTRQTTQAQTTQAVVFNLQLFDEIKICNKPEFMIRRLSTCEVEHSGDLVFLNFETS